MKKTFLTLLVLFAVTTTIKSQNKDIVFVEYFSYTNSIGSSYAKAFRDKVIEGLMATGRIMVKDVDSESSLKREGERQTEDASTVDEERLVTMKNLNAKYLIQGHLTMLHSSPITGTDGKISSYQGALVYSLKIIDVGTGTLSGMDVFDHSSSGLLAFNAGSTPEEGIANIMGAVKKDMVKFVNKYFPIEFT